MLLQLYGNPVNVNIIQVYAPTADKSEQEVEEFYGQVNEALSYTMKNEVNIVMEDFNAKVGSVPSANVTGQYGL